MTTHAYCYKGGKKPTVVRQTAAVQQESHGQAIATCPNGRVLIGVGWDTDAVPAAVDTSGEGVTATCPGKKKVVFAGAQGEYHYESEFTEPWATFITKLTRSSAKTAYAYGFNNPIGFDPTVSTLTVLAYCR
jgi:hypothetical protein